MAILQDGNNFGSTYVDLKYCARSVMLLEVQVRNSKIVFSPGFPECRDILLECFAHITSAAESIPRVM